MFITSLLQLIRVNVCVAMTNISSPSSNLKMEGHPLISGAPFRNHSQAVSTCTETSQRTETCVEDKFESFLYLWYIAIYS